MVIALRVNDGRCPHCGIAHEQGIRVCPSTGLLIAPAPSAPGQPRRAAIAPRPQARAGSVVRPEAQKPPPPMERSELVGGVIGDKYAIKGILGEGGMGVVYEAEHLAMGRIVAIKVLHPENAQKREAVSRLAHEAKVTGNLGHPNICEIYDMGRLDDGSPYVVMERLRGETLAQRIKRDGKVEPGPVVEIAMQVLSALAAAHASGIIHRDLKPENVFLAEKPGGLVVTKLLDFGISKAMLAAGDEDRLGLTQTGMVMGTPYYMAPEQARGDRSLDSRVDIWAVGVMMYEAMTGRRPFLAKNYNALLVKILTVWHRSLAEVDPTIPPALALAVDKALSKMPEDRYKNAADMQEALKRFLPKKEVAFPTSFALPSVRPVVETGPAAQQGTSKPPTFGLPELDLHDETADGVPWTAVKQYVPTGPRNAVNAAIAAQQQAPSQAPQQQHSPQPQAPQQAPQQHAPQQAPQQHAPQQAPQQQAPQQHASQQAPQQAPQQQAPQPQAPQYASRERGPESARAAIPAPRPTPVMPVVVPPAAIPPGMSARAAASPSETLRERASEGAGTPPGMQGRAPSAGPTSVRYPHVPSAPTGPPPPTPGQAWSPRNEGSGASAPRPPQAGSPGAPAAGPLPAPNAPRMAARRAATPPRPPTQGFGSSPSSPASGAPQAPSPAAYPSPSSPITGAPQAPQAPAQAAYANPQPNPYAAPQAQQPSHQTPQSSHPGPQPSHPAQSYQAPPPAYQAPQGYAPPQAPSPAQNPYSGSPQAAPQSPYSGSPQASPQSAYSGPSASPQASPQSAYSGPSASPQASPQSAYSGPSASPHGPSASPQSPYSGSPQAAPQAALHHSPQTSGASPPYAPRSAMPPQVSAAPTTGQAQGAPFAPRPGPAARVTAARVQKSPFPTPVPEPETVEDDATISEESSDGDDDQIETLVLVRDKLPLAKKLT